MFGRAVQSHEKSRPPPSHSNPASSTNSTQSSLQNAFTGKPATAPEKSKVSASITSFVNPAASTRRPTNFGLASLSASSAFDSKPTPPTLSESTGNSVSQLHDAVYFDDVDFSDEEDLEFAISQPILPSLEKVAKKIASPPRKIASPPRKIPSPPRKIVVSPPTKPRAALPVTNSAAKPSAPTMQQHRDDRSNHFNKDTALEDWDSDVDLLPKSQRVVEKPDSRFSKPAKPQDRAPPSSAPVPWSSSPVEHMAPRMPSISESIATIDLTSSRSSLVSSAAKRRSAAAEEAQGLHPKKRRTIPWENDPNAQLVEPVVARASTTAATATTSTTSTTSTTRTKSTTTTATTSSSIIKNRSDSLPWNDSFSNFEAGKKEARKQNALRMQKRSMHGEAANPEDVRSLRKTKESLPGIFLSEEQKRVVDLVATQGQSVFFTGSAGTGKSVLLRELIKVLKRKYRKDPDAVAVTASTGLAACNIGGVTLHSFAGIGLGKEAVPDLVRKIKKNQKARARWSRTKVLILDEISMVDGDLFDKLESVARQIRNNGRPFGGIQLVMTGDFFQLPPVPEGGKAAKFAFDANSWTSCIEHTIGLSQVFRQRDPEFANMLNEMRVGKLSKATVDTFKSLSRELHYDDGIQATELFSTRNEVDSANRRKMEGLPGEAIKFVAVDSGTVTDVQRRDKLLQSCMAPQAIELKLHSQVMLIKNVDDSLVNGSLGRVVGFMSEKMFDLMNDQGLSEKEAGRGTETGHRWPLVQFAMIDGTSRQLLCQPEIWKVELPNGEVQAQRTQVPLILAWALSIHKAQGQTLERVRVDLRRAFEKGQAYVALSRATCKEGLQVLGFDERKVMAHDRVREFYNSLYSAADASKRIQAPSTVQATAKQTVAVDEDDDEEAWRQFGAGY